MLLISLTFPVKQSVVFPVSSFKNNPLVTGSIVNTHSPASKAPKYAVTAMPAYFFFKNVLSGNSAAKSAIQ